MIIIGDIQMFKKLLTLAHFDTSTKIIHDDDIVHNLENIKNILNIFKNI